MTVLENSAVIESTPAKVWEILASLATLELYDPAVAKSQIVSPSQTGPGAMRRCELVAGGWFEEKIVAWNPPTGLSFQLVSCSLPVRHLVHSYVLSPSGTGTLVQQRMEYQLKFGPVGRVMDALMVRSKWDTGIKSFFAGLKAYAETGRQKD